VEYPAEPYYGVALTPAISLTPNVQQFHQPTLRRCGGQVGRRAEDGGQLLNGAWSRNRAHPAHPQHAGAQEPAISPDQLILGN